MADTNKHVVSVPPQLMSTDDVAAILGAAGAGFRVSLILNAVGCEVVNAPTEIHTISKTITLFSLALKQLGTALQTVDSVHSSEAAQTAQQIAKDGRRVFDEINEIVDRVRTKVPEGVYQPSIHQRFKWCFRKDRITYLLAQLESLKLSLSLISQMLQLGKLMAATSKNDSPEQVKHNTAAMQQERVEAQNIIIIRHIQLDETDRVFRLCGLRDELPLSLPATPITEQMPQLMMEPPSQYLTPSVLGKLPRPSLGDVDIILLNLRTSSKDMVRTSEKAIDPLLERWTRWREIREQRHRQGRCVPKVDMQEDDEDTPLYARYEDREGGNPRGYYLEGTTTDWRQPHSAAAKEEYIQKRKKYAIYQPNVSAGNSDDDNTSTRGQTHQRRSTKHVIDSSSESSESEAEQPKRRDSVVSTQASKPKAGLSVPQRNPPVPTSKPNTSPKHNGYVPSQPAVTPPQLPHASQPPRPFVSPQFLQQPSTQSTYAIPHYNLSSPLPPIHTYNAPNPYGSASSSPGYTYSPGQRGLSPQPRQYDQGHADRQQSRVSSRPSSRDSKHARSPSRLSYDASPRSYARHTDDMYDRYEKYDRYDRRYDRRDERRDDKKSRKDKSKGLRSGAAKGLLGAGAIAGFLEALEGLDL